MLNQLKLEYLKFFKNPVIKMLLIFFTLFFPLIYFFGDEMNNNVPKVIGDPDAIFKFPGVWNYIAYSGSYLVFFFLGVIAIYIVGLEVNYKTMRQSIINGMTRQSFFKSKLNVIIVLSLLATIYYTITSTIIGFAYTDDPWTVYNQDLWAIPRYFLMCFGYMSFALFMAFWIKRPGLAIFAYLSYVIIIEPLIRWAIHYRAIQHKFMNYYPMNALEDLAPNPMWKFAEMLPKQNLNFDFVLSTTEAVILSCIYTTLFIGLAYNRFMKKDL